MAEWQGMSPATIHAFQLPPEDEHGRRFQISVLTQLERFRGALIRSAIAVLVGMLVAFAFINQIVAFVLTPARHMLPPGSRLIFTQPIEAFSLYIDIALLAGAVLAAPFVMYQFWIFIAPALYSHQKKFAIPFVALTTIGAVCGAAFSHYIVFPYMIAFFGTFSSPDLAFLPRVEDTFDLYVKMMLGMIVVFQIPTVVFFLAKMGLVTARFLLRNTKYAILAIFIISAVVTPSSDPWNQTVFAAPMIVLYMLSIGIAAAVAPRAKPLDEEPGGQQR
jgi:sec-independent protein translocase protein TatC